MIIGSGLGGLLCGNILSREGLSVCVLEKHFQAGGCLQNFSREGCIFDTGIHYIGSLDEGQVLNRYFRYFGLLDELPLKRMDADGFDRISFASDPTEYPYAMGSEAFVERLLEFFPAERAALESYVARIRDVADHFPLYNISDEQADFSETSMYGENAYGVIASLTKNEKLRQVLAGTSPLYAGVRDKPPFYVHALVNYSFMESSWRVVDGSASIARLLCRSIENNGGTIMTRSEASTFRFSNGQISAVELTNGEIVEGRQFISDIHPAMILGMIPDGAIRKAYRNRIVQLENTISSFSVYIVFKKESFPYLNYNLYYYRNNDIWDSSNYVPGQAASNFLLLTPASSTSDQWADSIVIMSYMHYDEVKKWENTRIGKRGSDYEEFKKHRAEELISLVEEKIPDFRKHIHSYYTSSPLTYRDYTGSPEGSLYGVLKDCTDPLKSLISPRTKIPNLLLTGQNIILHGALGVTIAAVTTCSEILGSSYLVGKIKSQS